MNRPALRLAVALVFLLQLALLAIGITRDYRLKHEDNNALHATFARAHLQLGLGTTKGQNYFYSPARASGEFYANHPPGPGLALAAAYFVTGSDGPLVTRAAAILFHVLAAVLFLGLARRLFPLPRHALLATLLFVLLPESAFFGRMLNHEVLVLPAALLIVRGYWEHLDGGPHAGRWLAASAAGCVWAALAGWAGFFVMAACALHAAWELAVRRNTRARRPLVLLAMLGALLFAADLAHLAWVQERGLGHLRELAATRIGVAGERGIAGWAARIVELHWRYFGLTSLAALGVLAWRGFRAMRASGRNPALEVGLIWLAAGAGYVVCFSLSAAAHDYWQFLLLPASAIGIVLVWERLTARMAQARRPAVWRAVAAAAVVEILVTSGATLAQRHLSPEAYCIETVEALRRDML